MPLISLDNDKLFLEISPEMGASITKFKNVTSGEDIFRPLSNKKKLIMHIVVLFGLIVFLGGLDFLRGISSEGGPFSNPWAGASKLMMLIAGAGFCYLCVMSFIHARKQRAE